MSNSNFSAIDMATAAADGFRDGQRAAQSAPAGESEAFDKWFRAEQLIADHIDTTFISSAFLPYKAFQAGASWQRTQAAGVPEGLLEWAVGRWHSECLHRPLQNVHRRSLDDTWRQVIRRLGGDPDYLLGPDHSTLLAASPAQPAAQEQGEAQQSAHVSVPRELLQELVAHIEDSTCTHDSTHRGGAIWEICDDCGDKWADDRGGKPAFKWPGCVEMARALLNGGEA